MSDRDDKVDAAYRSLGRDGPSPALDARILAASRQALVRPSASRRWAAPVSIAAVLVLALGVTLRMQQEQPGVESPDMDATRPAQREAAAPAAPPADAVQSKDSVNEKAADKFDDRREAAQAPAMKRAAPLEETRAKKIAVPEAKPDKLEADNKLRDQARLESERKDVQPRASASMLAKETNITTQASTVPPPAAPRDFAPEPQAAAAAPAPAAPPARLKQSMAAPLAAAADAQALDEPTRELEAIAKLRAEGRQEDADKAIAEFRRKRPDYRIPDAMWERVKPR